MSHTVHPFAHRLGIIRDWKSRWFASGKEYATFLRADVVLREYLAERLRGMYISDIQIERGSKTLRIIIRTSRPGLIIGRSGEGSEKLRKDIESLFAKKKLSVPKGFKLDIEEVRSPESNAAIVASMIAEALEKRMPFRRVMKQTLDKVSANRDVLGVRICLSGRLGGTDIARTEDMKRGRVPLQTFRADIDFARERAHLPYGDLGIKVWIYRGEVFAKDKDKGR